MSGRLAVERRGCRTELFASTITGIPAGVLRADCHAGKDAGAPRVMGSFVFRSDLLTGDEPSRTRDEDEDEDEKRGQLPPGVDGGLVNARLRYFDPARKRAGLPEDVGALVSQLTDHQTVVTLVNLNQTEPWTLVMQGGAYGEHQFESVTIGERTTQLDSALLTVELAPGSGERLTLRMKRYANPPTALHPWQRAALERKN